MRSVCPPLLVSRISLSERSDSPGRRVGQFRLMAWEWSASTIDSESAWQSEDFLTLGARLAKRSQAVSFGASENIYSPRR